MENQRLLQLFEFLKISPTDAFTLYSIGYEYMNMQDWEKALHYFEKLLREQPAYVGAYYHLGKTMEQLNRSEDAIATYRSGMAEARKKGDMHTHAELHRALNKVLGLDYENEV